MPQSERPHSRSLGGLSLAALGIVYGDIGTSPLYVLKTVFDPANGLALSEGNLYGIVSLIVWALLVVVSLKYVILILRADNHGEGGIMALLSLATSFFKGRQHWRNLLLVLGIFGAALFYGDGVITPAISVLSAVEGLSIATALFTPYVLPITVLLLVALFLVQGQGTALIGRVFGPVMLLWFTVIAVGGARHIIDNPQILRALNPSLGLEFLLQQRWLAFVALGGVVLALTGAEALYADLGHFGVRPIRVTWTFLVFPALVINYLGQGALLLANAKAISNPFYLLFPSWSLYTMVALATIATVIASQAVISGTFSMTKQAIQLDFLPRLRIVYTSAQEIGQIYIPFVNQALLVAVIAAVLGFGSSERLGAAYGVAVTGTMLITTVLTFFVVRSGWHYNLLLASAATVFFFLIDATFFSANLLKIVEGGWFPLAIGAAMFVAMSTWRQGRALLLERNRESTIPLADFLQSLFLEPIHRVPGTAVFISRDAQTVPSAFLHNLSHNKVLHERVIFVTTSVLEVPSIPLAAQATLGALEQGCYAASVHYGFKDDADLPRSLRSVADWEFDPMTTSYFISREILLLSPSQGMAKWRKLFFIAMFRAAGNTAEHFFLPPNRVVELGAQVEL